MQPNIHLNWLAILVSVIASFVVGGLWAGPLFGRTWKKSWRLFFINAGFQFVSLQILGMILTFWR